MNHEPERRSINLDVHRLSIEVAVLKVQLNSLTKTCETLEETVSLLTATLNQSKGGWFILSVVASLGAALAGTVISLVQWLRG